MLLMLKVWGIDPTLHREGSRRFFDAPMDENWSRNRRNHFKELVRNWPEGH
jgi:hypothetical protein